MGACVGAIDAGCVLTGDDEDEAWGRARRFSGLFAPLADGSRRVELAGCAPTGGLRAATGHIGGRRARAGNAHLVLLDAVGTPIGQYFVNDVTAEAVKPSVHGAHLVDLTVRLWCQDAYAGAAWPWHLRRTGRLDRPGLWHRLDRAGRHGWLSAALIHHAFRSVPDRPPDTVYRLDGRHITDVDGFYCALGEAVNGPGGYFGWNADALEDCLLGHWGAQAPFALRWHAFAAARSHLVRPDDRSGRPPLEVIEEVFRDHRIDVIAC